MPGDLGSRLRAGEHGLPAPAAGVEDLHPGARAEQADLLRLVERDLALLGLLEALADLREEVLAVVDVGRDRLLVGHRPSTVGNATRPCTLARAHEGRGSRGRAGRADGRATGWPSSGTRPTSTSAGPGLGGQAATIDVGDGVLLERYYHHLFTCDREMHDLCAEIGVELETWPSTVSIFRNGALHPFTTPMDLLRFKPMSPLSRVRMGVGAALAAAARERRSSRTSRSRSGSGSSR